MTKHVVLNRTGIDRSGPRFSDIVLNIGENDELVCCKWYGGEILQRGGMSDELAVYSEY